jgi:hypothetical protein
MTIVSQDHIINTIMIVIDNSISTLKLLITIVSEDHIINTITM